MHVAHVETGALAGQSAATQGRQATLVSQFGQRVGLVHELRQLVAAEELANRARNGTHVDQFRGNRVLRLFQPTNAVLEHAVHAEQADANLVPHQLAGNAHAAVAQVVDVVAGIFVADVVFNQPVEGVDDVVDVENATLGQRHARQVQPHLVHVAVRPGVKLRDHADDPGSTGAHRRQLPGLCRAPG